MTDTPAVLPLSFSPHRIHRHRREAGFVQKKKKKGKNKNKKKHRHKIN